MPNGLFYDIQLQTFYNTRDQWELVDGTYDDGNEGITFNDGYSYAVTDIDDDGNLEILMSGMAGSGQYSINVFYEFSDIDTIEKMDNKGLEFNGSLHEGNNYYIDADGVCHLYEHFSYDSIDDEVLESDYPDSILNSYNVDWVEFSLLSASEDDLDPVYLYGIDIRTDDGFIDRTDETEELFLEAERILEERGYTIISDEEAEEMLQEFRESAGFTEEIYNAEVAYYGD